jgi:hypothetical protein
VLGPGGNVRDRRRIVTSNEQDPKGNEPEVEGHRKHFAGAPAEQPEVEAHSADGSSEGEEKNRVKYIREKKRVKYIR